MTNEVDDPARTLIVLVSGILIVMQGIRIRSGASRAFVRYYANSALPALWRNGAFLLLPVGTAFILSAIAGGMPSLWPRSLVWQLVRALFVLGAVGALAAFFWWGYRPPDWIKPRWIREAEDSRSLSVGSATRIDRLPQLVAVTLVAVIGGYVVLRSLRLIGP